MNITYRQATIDDLPDIVRMLADDFLGTQRESLELPLKESYIKAFREIEADPNNELIVTVESTTPSADHPADEASAPLLKPGGELNPATPPIQEGSCEQIIGTLQLIITPSLSYQGGKRSSVESVRVDGKYRGQGIGREMMLWAIERAREKGCISMHLTSHGDRKDAHRFYEQLGFKKTHVGMKISLVD